MFQKVVFAGGGHRCWWQAGWWEVVSGEAPLAPTCIAAVSAGAATACMLFATDTRDALAYYREALGSQARNAHWGNLLRRGRPVFPHEAIYRQALRQLLGGESFARLQADAPEIRVLFAIPPRWLGARSAVAIGLLAYNIEKYARRSLHPVAGRRLGFRPGMARVADCPDEDSLIDLLIASSSTPPFTALQRRGGDTVLDGGLVDNVPVHALVATAELASPPGPTLVLLTRRYPAMPTVFVRDDHVYVQPVRKVAASSWDYTAPASYEATWQQGREDAGEFLRWLETHREWLAQAQIAQRRT
ncbi:MAG: patatin-like phospholipase family protein [Burkholderiaceae bacterium]